MTVRDFGSHHCAILHDNEHGATHEQFKSCKLDHNEFKTVEEFLNEKSEFGLDDDVSPYLRNLIDRTVRVVVRYTSFDRPNTYSNSEMPYPCKEFRGNDQVIRYGTGFLVNRYVGLDVEKTRTCPCPNCKTLTDQTPNRNSYYFLIKTAAHVVFDENEAQSARFEMFYDSEDRDNVESVYGVTVLYSRLHRLETDSCRVICVTHNDRLAKKLSLLCNKEQPLKLDSILVSHPHGISKRISVGTYKQDKILIVQNKTSLKLIKGMKIRFVGCQDDTQVVQDINHTLRECVIVLDNMSKTFVLACDLTLFRPGGAVIETDHSQFYFKDTEKLPRNAVWWNILYPGTQLVADSGNCYTFGYEDNGMSGAKLEVFEKIDYFFCENDEDNHNMFIYSRYNISACPGSSGAHVFTHQLPFLESGLELVHFGNCGNYNTSALVRVHPLEEMGLTAKIDCIQSSNSSDDIHSVDNYELLDDSRNVMCDVVSVSFSSSSSREKDVSNITAENYENSEICEVSGTKHNLKDANKILYTFENAFQKKILEDCLTSFFSFPEIKRQMKTLRTNQNDISSRVISLKEKPGNHYNDENFISSTNTPESFGLRTVKNDLIESFQYRSLSPAPVEIQVHYLEAKLHPHQINGIPWKFMNNEWYRLLSFVKFPIDSPVSTIRLASKGFAYLINESEQMIICHFCITLLKTFNDMARIDEEHERLGPDCPMVKGTHSNNISMEQQCPHMNADDILSKLLASRQYESQMKQSHASAATPLSKDDNSIEVRSSQPSDESAPFVLVTNVSDIAESDSQVQDPGQSRQQSPILDDSASPQDQQAVPSQPSSVPQSTITGDAEAVQSSSTVENSIEQQNSSQQEQPKDSSNAGDENTGDATSYEKLGIITARPKRVEYAVYTTRFNSFNEWPKDHHMKPEDLAKAGYFYTGYSDCARCFYCGGGLRNWERDDDVWVEHARWFPKCAFLLQEVGKDFIDTVQVISKERDDIKFDYVIKRMPAGALTPFELKERPIERDPAVMSVIDNGFAKDKIIKLAQEIRKSGELMAPDKLYAAALARKFPKKECSNNLGSDSVSIRKGGNVERDKKTIETLRTENNELRSQTLCKICMDKEVAVVFLPCGHLVSCTECSCALTSCPVCRFGIKGIVRAYVG